jgi:hypothetical protein
MDNEPVTAPTITNEQLQLDIKKKRTKERKIGEVYEKVS